LDELKITQTMLKNLSGSLKTLAGKNKGIYLPGLTHLQHAMIISLNDYLGAYQEMLARDQQRLQQVHDNVRLTFGSGAIAGTSISASSYYFTSSDLPKAIDPTANSIDVVSDRDFIIETLSGLAVIGMHLSRLAEDMILWASKEFDFIDIDDAFCTGSSLMPQKKNPDVLELVRGYSGRLYGNLVNVLVMMKGLPLSYNRDMQLDKEPLFDSFDIVQKELTVLAELFKNVTFKKENIAKQLNDEALYATDLADYLVQNKVAFRDAHAIIGKLIQHKYQSGQELRTMDDQELKTFHPLLNSRMINKIIDPEYSVKSKKSIKR
ncbi:MAG: argininosuccinate lyase, partial [Candidatus Omnitrophota bacterium]|nr:argininosuccinate lyase [Candidatus Omnitrophota bacterium]